MLLDAHEESTGLLPQTVLLAAEGCDALDAPLSALRSSGIVELVELDGSSLEARIEEVTPSLVIAGPGVNSAIIGALARKKSISRILPPFLRFVTSTETEEDDLYLGFDDFVVASCSAAELEKRIRRLANASREREPSHLTAGPLTIDAEKYRVTVDGRSIKLAWMEFQLLRYLMQNVGRVFTREDLLMRVWGHKHYGHTRTVDVHIRRRRHKLGARQQLHPHRQQRRLRLHRTHRQPAIASKSLSPNQAPAPEISRTTPSPHPAPLASQHRSAGRQAP